MRVQAECADGMRWFGTSGFGAGDTEHIERIATIASAFLGGDRPARDAESVAWIKLLSARLDPMLTPYGKNEAR